MHQTDRDVYSKARQRGVEGEGGGDEGGSVGKELALQVKA